MDSLVILLSFAVGWTVAHLVKTLIFVIKGGRTPKEILHRVLSSGGMPSGHTACFTAGAAMIGILNGFTSSIFALAVCMEFIIIYDAINVRYSVGEQGKKLNKLLPQENQVKIVEGHTFFEVLVGFAIGVASSILVAFLTGNLPK